MVIEWLKIKVPPELRESYIQKEEEIWNPFLRSCPGFLGKEIWINPKEPDEVMLVIRWESHEALHSVSKEKLAQVEAEFNRAAGDYPMTEAFEYQVRKFPHTST